MSRRLGADNAARVSILTLQHHHPIDAIEREILQSEVCVPYLLSNYLGLAEILNHRDESRLVPLDLNPP